MACTLDVQNIFSRKENLCKYFYIILHGEAFADEKNRNTSPGKLPLLGPENVLLDKLLHNKLTSPKYAKASLRVSLYTQSR